MNKERTWFALEITVISEAAEAIEFGLNELDALGTEINNLGKKPTETLKVIGYFSDAPADENVKNQLNEALRIYGFAPDAIREIGSRRIGNVDWLFEWKRHWKPTVAGKFIIAPTWEKIDEPEKIVIFIEPNMAFGTGTHETTRLCLMAIEENYKSGMSFLDVGTGTGILTIAARKLGAENAQKRNENVSVNFAACDTDFDSIKIAEENAELNETDGINFYVGSLAEDTPEFDFICANLTPDIIVPLLPLLTAKARKILVLSGILKEQESLMKNELDKLQISNFKIETLGEWISITISVGK